MGVPMSDIEVDFMEAPEDVDNEQNHEGDNRELILNIANDADRTKEDDPGLAEDNEDVLAPFLSQEQRRIDPTDEELSPSGPA
jgi:hypothetical protein